MHLEADNVSLCASNEIFQLTPTKRVVLKRLKSIQQLNYRPQRSCEGYVFTGVCLSTRGEGVCLSADSPPPPEADTPHVRHPPTSDTALVRHPPGADTPQKFFCIF